MFTGFQSYRISSILLVLYFLPIISSAQSQTKVTDWLNIAERLYRSHPDSAYQLAQAARSWSQAQQWQLGIAQSHDLLGLALERKRDLDSARWYFQQADHTYEQLQDTMGMAKVRLHQGALERRADVYDEALEYYFAGVRYAERSPPSEVLGSLHNGLGLSYRKLENFVQAEFHLLRALELRRAVGDPKGRASSYSSLANLYGQTNKLEDALMANDSALYLYRSLADTTAIMRVLNNMGNLYLAKDDYEKAEANYYTAIGVLEQRNEPDRLVSVYNNLATLYSRLHQHEQAIVTYKKALNILGDQPAWALRRLLLFNLSTSYEQLGQHERANDYLKQHLPYRDSTFNEEALVRAKELEKKYELAEKQRTLTEQEQTITQQQNQLLRLGLIALLLAVSLGLVFAFFQFRSNRRRRRYERDLARLLRKQESLLLDAMLRGQEKAQQHFASELHDNIGMLLSTVNLHFSRIEDHLPAPDSILSKAKSTLIRTVQEVRNLSHKLMSGTLLHLGLVPALQELKEEITNTGILQVSLHLHEVESLQISNSTTHSLYRVIQELLTNTLRHAQATQVDIQLTRRKDALNLVFQDNGIGFVPDKQIKTLGIGLQNVRARIEALEGQLHMDTRQGEGTTVIVDVPIQSAGQRLLISGEA